MYASKISKKKKKPTNILVFPGIVNKNREGVNIT